MWKFCAVFIILFISTSYAEFQCPICTGSDCENDVQISSCSNVRNVLFIDAPEDVKDYKCVYLEYKDGGDTKVARKCLASTSYEKSCTRLIRTGSVTRCEITEPNKFVLSASIDETGGIDPTATTPSEPTTATTPSEPTTATTPSEPTTATTSSEPTTATTPSEPTTATTPSEPTTTTVTPSEQTTTTAESTTITMESTTTSVETTTQGGNISNPMSALIILIISIICKFLY